MRHSSQRRFAQVQWLAVGPLIVGAPEWTYPRAGLFLAGLAVTSIASYGPDLDHHRSKATVTLPAGAVIHKIMARLGGGHRMGTHSLLSVALAGVAAGGCALLAMFGWGQAIPSHPMPLASCWVIGAAAALGWWGGIFPDLLTVQGAGVLYPFSRRRVRLLNLRTSPPKPAAMLPGEALFNGLLFLTGLYFAASILAVA